MAKHRVVRVIVREATGVDVNLDWHSRSAVHRELKDAQKKGLIRYPLFYRAFDEQGDLVGVGIPHSNGWSASNY